MLSGLFALFGCSASGAQCPAVAGVYTPQYTPIDGNCGTIANPYPVKFDGGPKINTNVVRLPTGEISTEVIMKGCTVRMTQVFTDENGNPASQLDGEALNIDSPEQLSGTVNFMLFDATTGGVACTGTYSALFVKMSTQVGGAVGPTM
jgi:hypothetical protein